MLSTPPIGAAMAPPPSIVKIVLNYGAYEIENIVFERRFYE